MCVSEYYVQQWSVTKRECRVLNVKSIDIYSKTVR